MKYLLFTSLLLLVMGCKKPKEVYWSDEPTSAEERLEPYIGATSAGERLVPVKIKVQESALNVLLHSTMTYENCGDPHFKGCLTLYIRYEDWDKYERARITWQYPPELK